MNSYSNEYAAKACSINIEDITSDHENQEILRRLRDNDPTLTTINVCSWNMRDCEFDYSPDTIGEMGWLGYFIGKNVHLLELNFDVREVEELVVNEDFCAGLCQNTSIRKIHFYGLLSGGELFRLLVPFFNQNHNLAEIEVENCALDAEGYQLMAMAIGGCSGSLTTFSIVNEEYFENEHQRDLYDTVCIPLALSMYPKLREIKLSGIDIGRNTCMALATLIKNTTTELEILNVDGNGVDDEGVLALIGGLQHSKKLSSLAIGGGQHGTLSNPGWQSLSTLLENPSSNLEVLHLYFRGSNDGAQMLANALHCNQKLKILSLYREDITTESWSLFNKLICDTTSIDSTFMSNHTLVKIQLNNNIPNELRSLLSLNGDADKKKVAMTKILKYHRAFNMKPFFEWDLKVLPLMINWLERAADLTTDFETHVGERKFSSIYQFVRGMPMVFMRDMPMMAINSWSG